MRGQSTAHCILLFLVVQSLCPVQLFATPQTAARQASLSFTISPSLLRLMSIESMIPSISPSVSPFSSCPQSFPASGSFPMSRLFASKVDKVLELQHQSSQWYLGLIPFRIDWFDLLAVQGTLKSLLQHHKLKANFCYDSLYHSSH